MRDRKYDVVFARFPGNNQEHPASSTWMMRTLMEAKADERVGNIHLWQKSDTPITMTRNQCIQDSLKLGADFILMIDSDMQPDFDKLGVSSPSKFWPTTFSYACDNYDSGPHLIAAPYCGPPPFENIYVFEWQTRATGDPEEADEFKLGQYTREQAADKGGIKEAAALPTGLILIDTRVFTGFKHPVSGHEIRLEPPYFYYEWSDETHTKKASTEDVTMTRDASMLGAKVMCNWDAWALHWKLKAVGRPHFTQPNQVSKAFKRAMNRNSGAKVSDE